MTSPLNEVCRSVNIVLVTGNPISSVANDNVKAPNDTVNTQNDIVKAQNDIVNDTVFSLIKQNKNITAAEIKERLNMSLSTISRKIKDLKEQGIIVRMGSDKTGYWKITKQ